MDTRGGRRGAATFECSDGAWNPLGGAVCGGNCGAVGEPWRWGDGGQCAVSSRNMVHGISLSVRDTDEVSWSPGTGTAKFTCEDGILRK